MYAWGAGTSGQLGSGALHDAHTPQSVQSPRSLSALITAIACGGSHAVAITGGGAVLAWGACLAGNAEEKEAQDEARRPIVLTPRPVKQLAQVVVTQVAAGWGHTAFLTGEGRVYVAGEGSTGQLGLGTAVQHAATPLPLAAAAVGPCGGAVAALGRVRQLACGLRHTLLLLADGSLLGCGSSNHRQLGPGCRAKQAWHPQAIVDARSAGSWARWAHGDGRLPISSLLAGGDRSGMILSTGHLLLWGRGLAGRPDNADPVPAVQGPEPQAWDGDGEEEAGTKCQAGPLTAETAGVGGHSSGGGGAAAWAAASLGWRQLVALDCRGSVWMSAAPGSAAAAASASPAAAASAAPAAKAAAAGSGAAPAGHLAAQPAGPQPVQLQRVALPGPALCVAAGAEHFAAAIVVQPSRPSQIAGEDAGAASIGPHTSPMPASRAEWGRPQGQRPIIVSWGWGEHGQLGAEPARCADQQAGEQFKHAIVQLPTAEGPASAAATAATTTVTDPDRHPCLARATVHDAGGRVLLECGGSFTIAAVCPQPAQSPAFPLESHSDR